MKSIFKEKQREPSEEDLKKALGKTYEFWGELYKYTLQLYPKAKTGWNFQGEKYGWSYRISDNKRVIVYLLPRDKFFKTAFVFGNKASEEIFNCNISETIKEELRKARIYAEGRGIRIEVREREEIADLKKLIEIKTGF